MITHQKRDKDVLASYYTPKKGYSSPTELPLSQWTATLIGKRNFFKAPTFNVEDEGTTFAQRSVAGVGNATRCHTL